MRRITLKRHAPDVELKAPAPAPRDDQPVLNDDVAIIDAATNEVVAVQITAVPTLADKLGTMFRHVKWPPALNSAGNPTDKNRLSGIRGSQRTFGFAPPSYPRRRYACAPTKFQSEYPTIAAALDRVAATAHELFALHAPAAYEHTHTHVHDNLQSDFWLLGGTNWSSGIINNNAALPYHMDSGNVPGSWSAMLTCRRECDGGYLHLADYDVHLGLPNGSIAIFDGQSVMHGVTPFRLTKPNGYRYTSIWYAPMSMGLCAPTLTEEAVEAQRRATHYEDERAEKRRQRVSDNGDR